MARYGSDKQHRRSIRLRRYDYAQPGAYLVTICTQDRQCLFGEIHDGQMILNEVGQMIARWRDELLRRFPSVALDEFAVMPNHFHGIVVLQPSVGADLCVRPDSTLLTASDNLLTDEHASAQECQTSFEQMMEIALETVV